MITLISSQENSLWVEADPDSCSFANSLEWLAIYWYDLVRDDTRCNNASRTAYLRSEIISFYEHWGEKYPKLREVNLDLHDVAKDPEVILDKIRSHPVFAEILQAEEREFRAEKLKVKRNKILNAGADYE